MITITVPYETTDDCKEYILNWRRIQSSIIRSSYNRAQEGDFYRVSNGIKMVQQVPQYYYTNNEKELYGCPSCNKIFME